MSKMKSFILFILALLLVCHFPVEAGNHLWEPSHQSSLTHARWAHFDNHRRTSTSPWPNKLIPICYGNLEAERELGPYIKAAMDLWYAAGLPAEYKIQRAHHLKCVLERPDVLWVYIDPGAFFSSVGKEKPKENPRRGGPVAALHISHNQLGDPAANIAHELGHAWGLLHENHNPVFWAPNNFDKVFKFRCDHLADFDDKIMGLQQWEIWGHDGICRSSEAAMKAQFSAYQYLPIHDAVSKHGWYVTEDDVDWNSIMMLPSWVGGNHRGSPLFHLDGGLIGANLVPSAQDVEGIRHLYEYRLSYEAELLLNDPRAFEYSLFRQYAPGCGH
ncbi:uncharacterized protein DSM5745_02764 [Aspergillus mulundensis]|uniref:Peptidase M12A domain-containing protein n=1 Tax=Aspergillus mulundensis TaxID=1810919 RepID=A0A3D8SIL8_9EURO|nr:hypothetical protein DSM5745_02764 [Aspergillus mulundensis]RDW86122.1 hypothetical protein DSM5745_02764 [Aspergillus mulundensis]